MTWREFKAAVEAQGVQDEDLIDYIDIAIDRTVDLHVVIVPADEAGPREIQIT